MELVCYSHNNKEFDLICNILRSKKILSDGGDRNIDDYLNEFYEAYPKTNFVIRHIDNKLVFSTQTLKKRDDALPLPQFMIQLYGFIRKNK